MFDHVVTTLLDAVAALALAGGVGLIAAGAYRLGLGAAAGGATLFVIGIVLQVLEAWQDRRASTSGQAGG